MMFLKVNFFIVASIVLGLAFSDDATLSYDDYKKHVLGQKVYNLLKQKYSDCDEAVRLHRITDGVGM